MGIAKKHRSFSKKVNAVDLFCGAGGLTRGLEKAGIYVSLGIDIDPTCRYPYTVNNNAKFLLKSVHDVIGSDLCDGSDKKALKLLAGCAPCQTFSSYNQKADSSDKRWWLLLEFTRLIEELSPELVTMENVPGLKNQNVFREFVKELQQKEYHVTYDVINCAEYGLPQNRNRLVLLASKLGPISLLPPDNFSFKRKTVWDTISKLPPLKAGEIDPKDSMHQCSALTAINYKRMLQSKPGGTWRDWPKGLIAKCHRKESGKTYPSVYGRMSWDKPSPTITTQFFGFGNGRFGHPQQDRAISLREGAMLQSFPKNYKFVPTSTSINKKALGRLIGNAVPVKLGLIIGKSILKHVEVTHV